MLITNLFQDKRKEHTSRVLLKQYRNFIGAFVMIITKINPGNDNTKLTQLDNTLAIGKICLGTYTFFIKDAFSNIEPIAVLVASE